MALYGLWRMDYLSPMTAHHIRMTDTTRTAYVAKNIAEGRGYKTNELPSFLIDFYDQRGKLHGEWTNADRFPFTAYAIAALYVVTGSTSWEVGILGYNLVTFVLFLLLLYWFTRVVWNSKWPAVFAVGLALLLPTSWLYLYLKDADMMLLTTGVLLCFYRYLERPERMTLARALVTGTVLAWLLLDRPNIGGAFALCFGLVALQRGLALRHTAGWRGALRAVAFNEGIVFVAIAVWCLPFVIHSMLEWGAPFFSANMLYQMPLGTRFAMNTDTWWKYSEPGHTLTLGTLSETARGELIAKFTTSWVTTLKVLARAYPLELALGVGMLAWLGRRIRHAASDPGASDVEDIARARRLRRLGAIVGVAVLINFVVLPLYGAQNYGYRHYLSFFLPFFWMLGGQALILIAQRIWPVAKDIYARLDARSGLVLFAVVVAMLVWNVSTRGRGQEANYLFVRTSEFLGQHWLGMLVVMAALLWYRLLRRIAPFHRAVAIVSVIVFMRYQPYLETKRLNLKWFPADTAVWDTLREGKGMVLSYAMQGEVNWVSDRQDFPAPEYVMHVYSLLYDHKLEMEDVYLESAEALLDPWDGVFAYAAPGFESYMRMQKYHGRLPGYRIAFDAKTTKGYPKFEAKRQPKASTVYRLVDREAVKAMAHSPRTIELGKVDDVVYTAHGWGDYFTIDGRPVVAATNTTRARYRWAEDKPWEDTSTTFFLDEHRPTSLDLEVYATHATTIDFYWNLDLYYYDARADRPKHHVASRKITAPGWQKIHLDIPPGVMRTGFNKLGFRSEDFCAVVVCPQDMTEVACSQAKPDGDDAPVDGDRMLILRDSGVTVATPMRTALFVQSLTFNYDAPAAKP